VVQVVQEVLVGLVDHSCRVVRDFLELPLVLGHQVGLVLQVDPYTQEDLEVPIPEEDMVVVEEEAVVVALEHMPLLHQTSYQQKLRLRKAKFLLERKYKYMVVLNSYKAIFFCRFHG